MMVWIEEIYRAPLNSGNVFLGRTLPSLLDQGCDRAPNPRAFNQWTETGWQSLSNQAFQSAAEQVASGLLGIGCTQGDRVALLMYSDVNFCIADMGCLLANLVDVPIDLTQTLENIVFILKHSEAKALIISNLDLLAQLVPHLAGVPDLRWIIVADVPTNWSQAKSEWVTVQEQPSNQPSETCSRQNSLDSVCLDIPMLLHPVHADPHHSRIPQCIGLASIDELQNHLTNHLTNHLQNHRELTAQTGLARELPLPKASLLPDLTANTLATLIYIPDEMGQLQGVMLTHENLSANALASFSGFPDLQRGSQEVVLSFLPFTHVFARSLLYGHICYGHSIYFSTPNRVFKHLKEIQPTVLATVPLLLEKMVEKTVAKIGEKGNKAGLPLERCLLRWALQRAAQYQLGYPPTGIRALLLKVADGLVLSKWRSLFGDRLKYLLSGGAALKPELTNLLAAARIPILQGYGLTQTSSVICYNRGAFNRAGTVGVPIAGVELAIADDGEILVRGPYVSPGYYKNSAATAQLIDPQGWLHTGDLGQFSQDGFLTITGLKKSLFKLSTGKYIAPQPIEQRLMQSLFIATAIVIGSEHKFCAALIFPNLEALHSYALELGLDLPVDDLLHHPCIISLYQGLVDVANCHLPYWGTVKRFQLINQNRVLKNQPLTLLEQLNRSQFIELFYVEIENLYQEDKAKKSLEKSTFKTQSSTNLAPTCPILPPSSCPTFAQSLNPRLTGSQ